MNTVAIMTGGFLLIAAIVAAVLVNLGDDLPEIPGSDGTITYNGFVFVENRSLWQTQWIRGTERFNLEFRYNPLEVLDIPVEGTIDERFQNDVIFLTIDASDEVKNDTAYTALAAIEIASKLTQPFQRDVLAACTSNSSAACKGRPIVTCKARNSSVVYLKETPETKIILDGNCATIQGSGEDMVRAADNAIYQWLGIIQ